MAQARRQLLLLTKGSYCLLLVHLFDLQPLLCLAPERQKREESSRAGEQSKRERETKREKRREKQRKGEKRDKEREERSRERLQSYSYNWELRVQHLRTTWHQRETEERREKRAAEQESRAGSSWL